MNKKTLAIGLIAVLAVSIGIVAVTYLQEQSNHEAKEANTYTIKGTLCYLPGQAIAPGISATTITPTVSPWPSNITITNVGILGESVNETVYSFIFLQFSYNTNGAFFPVGFEQGDVVKISGQMSYSNPYYNVFKWTNVRYYVMNVTSITHISS